VVLCFVEDLPTTSPAVASFLVRFMWSVEVQRCTTSSTATSRISSHVSIRN
jgi:hypothetical protein